MNDFSSSDLKTILHSKRANLYYLEHCRVLVHGGRVEYLTDEGKCLDCDWTFQCALGRLPHSPPNGTPTQVQM